MSQHARTRNEPKHRQGHWSRSPALSRGRRVPRLQVPMRPIRCRIGAVPSAARAEARAGCGLSRVARAHVPAACRLGRRVWRGRALCHDALQVGDVVLAEFGMRPGEVLGHVMQHGIAIAVVRLGWDPRPHGACRAAPHVNAQRSVYLEPTRLRYVEASRNAARADGQDTTQCETKNTSRRL